VSSANAALEIEDPWEALTTFVEGTVAKHAKDRGLHEIMTATGAAGERSEHLSGKLETMREALAGPVGALVERAKAAGCLRSDASTTDFAAILFMMGPCYVASDAVHRPVWKRYLELLLDGLRSTGCPRLREPALELSELDVALSAAKKH